MKVTIIGTGRVATVFGSALAKANILVGIAGRDERKRITLAEQLGTDAYAINAPLPASDILLVTVSDDAIKNVASQLQEQQSLFVHTSGTKDLDQLLPHQRRAVMWPIQSLTQAPFDLSQVPLIIEGNSKEATAKVLELATELSNTVVEMPLEKRKYMHLAAVLTSNFPVHLMAAASDMLDQKGLDPTLLLPLWNGMAARVSKNGAKAKLTGPAIRGDKGTINEHLTLLEDDPALKDMYESLTKSILNKFHGKADL